MKTKKHSSLDRGMCTEHRMLRRKSNMEVMQTSILQPVYDQLQRNVYKSKFPITKDL